jgi:hypothetical protein
MSLDAAALHRLAAAFNWDGGLRLPRAWANDPACERATALLLYWRLAPHAYRRFASVDAAPARLREAVALAWELEARLVAGAYPVGALRYDPRDDGGLDRTRASDEEERGAVRPIPASLEEACGEPVAPSDDPATPERLERACRAGALDAVDAAMGAWAGLSPARRKELVGMAVERDHLAVVERLARAGGSVRGASGHRTLLDDATSVAMLDLLVSLGAQPAKATLALSVSKGAAFVRRLVALGAPIEGVSRFGETALYRAAADGHVEVVWALVELGANREAGRVKDGRTPLRAVDERIASLLAQGVEGSAYDSPERAAWIALVSVRSALSAVRQEEDARYG